jgi:hypothetical protein
VSLSKEEQTKLITDAIETSFQRYREENWVKPEQHYKDHLMLRTCFENQEEMRLNHEFVSSVRGAGETVKTATIWSAVGLLITTFVGFIIYHLKNP